MLHGSRNPPERTTQLLIRLLPPGDRKVLIRIFSFALLLPSVTLSPDGRPNAPTASGDKQARKPDGLASSVVCCVRSRRSQSGTIQVRLLPLAMGLTLSVDSLPALLGVRKET